MGADLLREAARLMRERAGIACASAPDQPWRARDGHQIIGNGAKIASVYVVEGHRSADHIASWHPAVALAVADWLEATARELVVLGDPDLSKHPQDGRRTAALRVARDYLGES